MIGLITKTLSSLATQAYGKFRWELWRNKVFDMSQTLIKRGVWEGVKEVLNMVWKLKVFWGW